MGLEQMQPVVREKTRELWGNRRKFLSRGFIGATTVFIGTSSCGRGATEISINHPEEIINSPMLIPQIPNHVKDIPLYAESAVRIIDEHTNNLKATRIQIGQEPCYIDGEEKMSSSFKIHTPYAKNIDGTCIPDKERSIEKANLARERQLNDDGSMPKNDAMAIFRLGLGSVIIGTGVLIARNQDSDKKITRRKLLISSGKGALGGVAWYFIGKADLNIK